MESVVDIVLEYPKLKEYLAEKPGTLPRALKIVEEIRGNFKESVVGSATTFIDKTFMRLYDGGVNLEMPEGFDLKKLQEKYHLVMVPNHQSHADYVALTYLFYKHFGLHVYVAAGINLKVFLLGDFFKRCGAFFIRRTFNNDALYRYTFEAYVYYLLKTDKIVEFFFEGGRTRTGKLLKPRYGLFTMLLESHAHIDSGKPLMFVPVSIAHEHIPEERAHAKELRGGKKEKEKATQLFKLFNLFNKKLGTVHVRLSEGIVIDKNHGDIKGTTQELAFECFKAVGRAMPVTPTSLLALVMLDDPQGALTWKQIEERSVDVINFCEHFNIPMTASLKPDVVVSSLKLSMDMFINNKKVELVKREKLGQLFYTIREESRVALLYHKNMILHHFLVPCIINSTWFNIFNGNIKNSHELTKFLLMKRKELKYEFYLPSVRDMIDEALRIIQYATGKEVQSLKEAMELSSREMYDVAFKVRRFSTAFSYIYEAYFISVTTVKYLEKENFDQEKFLQIARELHTMEREHGRVVKYPESYSVPLMKDGLEYLKNIHIVSKTVDGKYQLVDLEKVNKLIEKFAQDVNDQVAINLKFH